MHAASTSSLNIVSAPGIIAVWGTSSSAYLDSRSVGQATLQLQEGTADLVLHGRLALLMMDAGRRSSCCCGVVLDGLTTAEETTATTGSGGGGGGVLTAGGVCERHDDGV